MISKMSHNISYMHIEMEDNLKVFFKSEQNTLMLAWFWKKKQYRTVHKFKSNASKLKIKHPAKSQRLRYQTVSLSSQPQQLN